MHPTRPALVIEVADSSLTYDRQRKASLYARAGIQDYWIVNLVERVLEVYRDPGPDPMVAFGWRYQSVTALTAPAVVVPLAFASIELPVAELLP